MLIQCSEARGGVLTKLSEGDEAGGVVEQPVVNFVIAGAMKAGITSASALLSQHDQVYVSASAEPFFVAQRPSMFARSTKSENVDQFAARGDARAVGDVSASYLYAPQSLSVMQNYNPEMRVVVLLRDPVFRAHAHWNMQRQKGVEDRSFEEAVVTEIAQRPSRFDNPRVGYLDRGFYARHLERLWSVFPPEQCLIVESSLFKRDPSIVWSQMIEFLGLDSQPAPELAPNRSDSGPRADYPIPLARETGQRLREFYTPEVDRLERLLGWDLEAWRAARRPGEGAGDNGVEAGRVHRNVSGDERAA